MPTQIAPGSAATSQPTRQIFRGEVLTKFFTYTGNLASTATGGDGTQLGSGAIGTRVLIPIAGEADFAIVKTAALADNYGAKVQMLITPVNEQLQIAPCFLSSFGSGRLPKVYTPPWYVSRSAVITLIFDDRQLVAGAQNVFVALHGLKVFRTPFLPARSYAAQKQYAYIANFTADDGGVGALASNGTAWATVRTDGDSDFEVTKLSVLSDGPVKLQIQSDGDYWMNSALRGELLSGSNIEHPEGAGVVGGSGEFPFVLPVPRIVTGGGYLSVFATDLSGAGNRCQVIFHGPRLYPAGGLS